VTKLRKSDEEIYRYLDQFVAEYRRGDRVAKIQSKEDGQVIDRLLNVMHRYEIAKSLHKDALSKPELTLYQAIGEAKILYPKEKNVGKVAADLQIQDTVNRQGLLRYKLALEFLELLDAANARQLIQTSEDEMRKLEECTDKNTNLLKQLHDAQQKIVRLETMIRVMGGNPDEASSYSGDVQGGDLPE
jgi:hypothetical protein